ncbi:DUF6491 family protein [Erythrobacter aureus]|uniref:DUF6491 family protein n=1 Tax=Erythrobacter aureus TaxID=2182384 RepID=UPI003A8F0184
MVRLAVLALFLLTAACVAGAVDGTSTDRTATNLFNSDPRLGPAADTVCFTGNLNGFYELTDRALVVRRTIGKAYLVRTGHCPNLRSIEGLDFESGDRCLQRGDRIAVYDTPFPRADAHIDRPDRCTVLSIHEWREE